MSKNVEVNSHATSTFVFIGHDYDKNHRYELLSTGKYVNLILYNAR